MQNPKKTKPFVCVYNHDGAEWCITIHAYDWDDAKARVKKLGFLKLDFELIATVPARLGFVAKTACAVRNFFWRPQPEA